MNRTKSIILWFFFQNTDIVTEDLELKAADQIKIGTVRIINWKDL